MGGGHRLVLCKMRLGVQLIRKKPPVIREKFNIESFDNDSTRDLYKSRLKERIATNPITAGDTIYTAWSKIKINIISAAEEAIGKRKVNVNAIANKPWFTPEIKTLAAEKRAAYIKYLSNKTDEQRQQYVAVRNRVNAKITQIKKDYWEKFSTDMQHDLYGGQRRIWNFIRSQKKPVNEQIVVNITPEEWTNHLKSLYNTEEQADLCTITNNIDNYIINKTEITTTTNKLKNRKSPGPDKITNEMLKYGGDELMIELSHLYSMIMSTGEVPQEWKSSITIPIYKKGEKKDPRNYRGISLLNTAMKLLTKIITQHLSSTVSINEEQQGFRQNRSTIDAIFILRQIIEKSIEFNKPAFLCFVDLTQAFDRVQLKDVLKILQERRVSNNIIQVIKQLNTNNSTRIQSGTSTTEEVQISIGIRQGDSLSPMLFNLVMDRIINQVKGVGRGYRMGQTEFKILCYADDAVLIAESEDNLQRMLFEFNQTANKYNMSISIPKTKSMTISKEPIRCKLALNDQPIEQVMSFEYLGIIASSSRNTYDEVKTQVNKAARVSGCLHHTIWKNKHMSITSKARIYRTAVRPILTYAAETRADTNRTKRALRTTEMRALRAIAGVTLRDRQKSNEIRERCDGMPDVVRWSRGRRREWREHVDRMGNDRLAKAAYKEKPNTTRPLGRPPKRWADSWTSSSQDIE